MPYYAADAAADAAAAAIRQITLIIDFRHYAMLAMLSPYAMPPRHYLLRHTPC